MSYNIVSGIIGFAQAYNVKSAHYTAIGDATAVKVGWYDYKRKQFKVIPVDTSEITSFIGNITLYNGKPVAHTHVNVATKDGLAMAGICCSYM